MLEDVASFGKSLFGVDPRKAIADGICVMCKKPAAARCKTPADLREHQISGLCGICWDEIFKEPDGN